MKTINNYMAFPYKRPTAFRDKGEIDEILKEYGSKIPFVSTANICRAKIRLRTNSKHVAEFWSRDEQNAIFEQSSCKGPRYNS